MVYPVVAGVMYQHNVFRIQRYFGVGIVFFCQVNFVMSYAVISLDNRLLTVFAYDVPTVVRSL